MLRIRKTPSLSAEVVGHLNKGESTVLLEKSSFTTLIDGKEDCWYEVRNSFGISGWVFGGYVDFSANNQRKSSAKNEGGVGFCKRQKVFEIPLGSPDGSEGRLYTFYKVGVVKSGKYKNGELLQAFFDEAICKGRGCNGIRLRLIQLNKRLVLLPKISAGEDAELVQALRNSSYHVETDSDYSVPILEYPSKIQGPSPRQVLELLEETYDEFDSTKFTPDFHHNMGIVYSRVPGKVYFSDFFLFRPDGTRLRFGYKLDFSPEEIEWKNTGSPFPTAGYRPIGKEEYAYGDMIYPVWNLPNLPALIDPETDLVLTGRTKQGDFVYELKTTTHPFLKQFYADYRNTVMDSFAHNEITIPPKTYEEFLSARPLFFWRDPFNRIIAFLNGDFLATFAAEPVIYLYPPSESEIEVRVRPQQGVSNSKPLYGKGWKVKAEKSGQLTNVSDGKKYPFLFWEGLSYVYPLGDKGFVVRKEEVESFLKEKLQELGLNEVESNDFWEAWNPEFKDSPYFYITFIDPEVMNALAPLEITPKPNTTIRVMMDFKPLKAPINVPPLRIAPPPKRQGFTVVEWGGLKRQ